MKQVTPVWWWAMVPLALAACDLSPRAEVPARRERVLATFVANVDAETGTLTIRPDAPAMASGAFAELPWVQDGTAGSGPPDTVELVTEAALSWVADGCGGGAQSYEAPVRLRSFFASSAIRNAHVEITGMTATGFEGCGSAYPAPDSTTRAFGLFAYGTLGPAGTPADSAVASWRFRFPSMTSFTMWGHVVGDLVPAPSPTVTGVSPSGGQAAGSVQITFSEPMDVTSTAAAISVSGAGGPVPGSVAGFAPGPLGGSPTFTFVPDAPFAPGPYTVGVSTAAVSALGLPLAAAHASSFTIVDSQLSASGYAATLRPGGVAFDRFGNGLAVWQEADPGRPWQGIFYSSYSTASGSWSAPVLLDANGAGPPRVAASATQLAVVYRSGSGLVATIFSNGIPGLPQVIAMDALGDDGAIASNGTGFAVVWAGPDRTHQAIFDGASWLSAWWPFETGDMNVTNIAVAAAGAGYRAVWLQGSNVRYAGWTGPWFDVPQTLGMSTPGVQPALAAYFGNVCIAWRDLGIPMLYIEQNGVPSVQPGLWMASSVASLAAAMYGSSCQVVAAASNGVFGALHDGNSWGPSLDLGFGASPADAVAVAPVNGSQFVVAARVSGATQDLLVNRTPFTSPAVPVDGADAPVRQPFASTTAVPWGGGPLQLVWAQADGGTDRIRTVRTDGTSADTPAVIASSVHAGSAAKVRLAADSSGNVLAVWEQQVFGQTSLFFSYRTGGAWSAPGLLAASAQGAVIASSGSDFMAVWTEAETPNTSAIRWQRFTGGAWEGTPATVASGARIPALTYRGLALASNGAGYALVYQQWNLSYQMATIFGGGAWSAPRQLTVVTPNAGDLAVAGRPGEYLFAWFDLPAGVYTQRATGSGASWTWDASPTLLSDKAEMQLTLASGPGGYAAVYRTRTNVEARIMTGATFGASTVMSGFSSEFAVASNGSGYLFATGTGYGADLFWRVHDGTAWGPLRTVVPNFPVSSVEVASDGTGYALLASYSQGLFYATFSSSGDLSFFSTAFASPGPSDQEPPAMVGTPAGYAVGWKHPDGVEGWHDGVYSVLGLP
jgi:hypothetical protein